MDSSYLSNKYKYAFIDESGNFGFKFDKQGCSSHFVITAIIIDKDDLEQTEESINIIRKKYFGPGEIKYSKLKSKKDKKIIEILAQTKNLRFKIISYIIDKRLIKKTSGLNNKKSFVKFLNNLLYNELKLTFKSLRIIADQHGTDKFMRDFVTYFDKQFSYDLFSDYSLDFEDSKANILIQFADFICGVISTGFEENRKTVKFKIYEKLLKDKILRLELWPLDYSTYNEKIDLIQSKVLDEKIAKTCIKLCIKYIKENETKKDFEIIYRVSTLKFLLYKLFNESGEKYISANVIRTHLYELSERSYSRHQFMSRIIAKLRDSEVIISSSSNGYKIPINEKQLYSYTDHCYSVIDPMMSRLIKCRKRILQTSENELDILKSTKYSKMLKYLEE